MSKESVSISRRGFVAGAGAAALGAGMAGTIAGCAPKGEKKPGYRTECVSAPIIHCRCSAGMWNSLQTIPEPYSSGALSFRLRLLEADANNPST